MKKNWQKFIAATLIVLTVLPATLFTPKKAVAQFVPVHDAILTGILTAELTALNATNLQTAIATGAVSSRDVGMVPGQINIPTTGQTALALTSGNFWATNISRLLLQRLTNSIVVWIDSGFQGSPAFVTDPGKFLLDVADTVAGEFIEGSDLGFLCDPFRLEIRFALNYRYQSSFQERISCRLSDVIRNIEDFARFAGDSRSGISPRFSQGGWSGWVSLGRQNQYSSYLAAQAELGVRIRGRQNIELLQLNWGSGFLSFQECLDPPGAPLNECKEKGPIKTPGSVIESGLAETLGSELTEIGLADSIDKILAALMNQLIQQSLGRFLGP